ncbi:MAG: SLC13 family permease [Pyrinomonadaceae bacterium MAG19_C2-C3]|nr:SLC13 family permease [Pyrinomonadaceae bacterium MAG19_C2-C3]
MTSSIAIVLALLVVAVVLFASERIPVDIVTIMLVIALVVTGTLTVGDAFAGFGNEIIITIAGLFILTSGLVKTGVVDVVGRRLHAVAGSNEFLLAALVMAVGAMSASILKNTTTTAMFLPVVLGLAARAKVRPSKLLMPLAFGAIMGGTCTLIGTSTNLAVSGAMSRLGLAPYTLFELTPIGLAIVAGGMLYMLAIGLRLLPNRGGAESFTEQYYMREYTSEVLVLDSSPLIGKTLEEANIAGKFDLQVVGVMRGKSGRIAPSADERVEAGDLLLVQGRLEDILRVQSEAGIEIKPEFELSDTVLEQGGELFEVLILRGSSLLGRTLKGLKFRDRYDLKVLAINRHGVTFLSKMSTVALRFGDVLLVQGRREKIEPLVTETNLLLLEDVSQRRGRAHKRKWAIIGFMVFVLGALSPLLPFDVNIPLPVAVLLGVLVLLASRTVRSDELYNAVEWRLLVLIAGMISFGVAMERTGADTYLAALIVDTVGDYGSVAVLAGFFVLTVALTQPMSNQAAALVVLPIAVKTALALGLNPRTFAVAVTYAASCSFLTPLEPACVLIYTPGEYRFMDFVKIGSILTLIVFAIVIWLVPILFPL